jgi:hypothetical protein
LEGENTLNKITMKRNTVLTVIGALVVAACWASAAFALMKIPTLEVTGQLEKVDSSLDPAMIFVSVDGTEASGPLSENCSFTDARGNSMERDAFVNRYVKKIVTLELIEDSGVVVSCRAN